MATQQPPAPQPKFRGFGAQDVEEKVAAGSAFEISLINKFLTSATTGLMPGSIQTTLPLLLPQDFANLTQPYSSWAPAPWSTLPNPSSPFGSITSTTPSSSPPPLFRIMLAVSGMDDIFAMALSGMLSRERDIPSSTKLLKLMTFYGLSPISDARWRAKGLDAEANIEEAIAVIREVVDLWAYLNSSSIQGELRNAFNKIYIELGIFQDACDAARAARGEARTEHNIGLLWREYMDKRYRYMEAQSRSWIFGHLKTIHTFWKTRFMNTFHSGRQISATQGTVKIDHWAMMVLTKIQELYDDAFVHTRMREAGYFNRDEIEEFWVREGVSQAEMNEAYRLNEIEKTRFLRNHLVEWTERVRAGRAEQDPTLVVPDFMLRPMHLMDRGTAFNMAAPEMETPPPRLEESWVTALADPKTEEFGFVVYRLAYGDEAEWKSFLARFEDGTNSGWEGLVGAEKIRHKSRLHWIDGREHGIAEGDLEAARIHFKSLLTSESCSLFLPGSRFLKNLSLAITPNSLSSFAATRAGDRKGDYRGFVHAIDVDYSPPATTNPPGHSSSERHDYHKAYNGTFKVIDQLIWTDLIAISVIIGGSVHAQEAWRLSIPHPWGVYVGPTTGVKRRAWREMRNGLAAFLHNTNPNRPSSLLGIRRTGR